jgi:cobalt-precorrin-5B (C1)-methyltransferase
LIRISVPKGEYLAKKTMNARLGIIGGISILGTTGIVEPLSISAYRHSILCGLDVAVASGCNMILLSTGRSSEKVAQRELNLPEEVCILIGDHMGFALKGTAKKGKAPGGLKKVIIAGQFGKFSKLASGHFETHCKDSSVELEFLADLAENAGAKRKTVNSIKKANTAREVFFILRENRLKGVFDIVCERVKKNAREIAGSYLQVGCILVGYSSDIETLAI